MKVFHCDHCGALVFFENVKCVSCDHALAFLPDQSTIGALEPAEDGTWRALTSAAKGRKYRLCANYTSYNVCNWALNMEDPEALCAACRLTTMVPDASDPVQHEAWYKLEVAKRRLIYTLMALRLPLNTKREAPVDGLAFELKAQLSTPDTEPVMTGHDKGVITINIAEANDATREQVRNQLHEPYRTLLGHFRHEVGHYYWDRLIANSDRLQAYRDLFGDERAGYNEALQKHYDVGPPADWQASFVSSYATSHPWEDWAETWAHYLHMYDALETAAACGLRLKPRRPDEPTLHAAAQDLNVTSFDAMIDDWFPLTYVLNNLNRGLGQTDAYPFVLSPSSVEKLRFVHETIRMHAARAD